MPTATSICLSSLRRGKRRSTILWLFTTSWKKHFRGVWNCSLASLSARISGRTFCKRRTMSSPTPIEYLQHILTEADYIVEQSADLARDEFLADETLKRAFVRSIEIIGEATKHVSDEFR